MPGDDPQQRQPFRPLMPREAAGMAAGFLWRRSRRGALLVTAWYVLVILSILSLSLASRGFTEQQVARQDVWQDAAFHLAEASVDAALTNFHLGNFSAFPSVPLGAGTYAADVTMLGGHLYQVVGSGRRESRVRTIETVIEATPRSVFQYPIAGDDGLSIRGNVLTDSYDSAAGSYSAATAGDQGDVATNSTSPGAITVSGSIAVNGQVAVGADATDAAAVLDANGGTYLITEDPPVVSMSSPLLMPSVTVPAGLTCTDLSLSDDQASRTLSAGTYCFNNLTVTGTAVLSVSGPVTIYVTGNFSLTGNAVMGNASSPPLLTMLMATPQSGTLSDAFVSGTTKFYGGLYAPDSTMTIRGTADIYGSLVAEFIDAAGNAQVHYDEAMQRNDNPLVIGGCDTRILSWRER